MAVDATKQFQPELYRSYLRILARVCLRSAGPPHQKVEASDIVQDSLMQALLALPQFHGATEHEFRGWLRVILENKLKDAIRHFARKKRDAAIERTVCETLEKSSVYFERRFERVILADQTSPSRRVLQNERANIIAKYLEALPADQRMAIELHHLGGNSLQETAEQMNRSTASVAGLLRRGLKALREGLQDQEQTLR